MRSYVYRFAAVGVLGFILLSLLSAQSGFVGSRYSKHEYLIPMRDGVKLFTAVYIPRDDSRKYPIMLHRTPYGVAPYGESNYPSQIGPSDELAAEGFIFAYQDVRGRMMSEGEFVNMRPYKPNKKELDKDIDESTDAYDTIDWLIHNIPNNNGKVGMWGISYPGFYAAAGMIDAHPALKAVSPQAPIADWFIGDDFHHNGAFFLPHAFGFLASFGRPRTEPTKQFEPPFVFPTQDGYEFYLRMGPLSEANAKYLKNEIPFWNEIMAHPNYDDFWQSRNLRPHLKNIRPAVMTVGGWFDAEDLFGALNVYQAVEASSPDAYNILVMGPWYHGAWSRSSSGYLGDVSFGSDTGGFYRREIEYPFFMRFLKDSENHELPEAYIFETGINAWRKETRWPPEHVSPRKLFFCSGGTLSWDSCPDVAGKAFDEYVSDPAKPVPYIEEIAQGMTREYMAADQRFAARRPDVLTFSTPPLANDISIMGAVGVSLSVSTTGTDADFVVKLIDVYPDEPDSDYYSANSKMRGYQQLVRGEPFRGKFRNSFSRPEPFVPGKITKIEYVMPDIAHTFRAGHRIMVQAQSSWFPLIDRNPQKFMDIPKAKESDFRKATQRVFHSRSDPSFITLPCQD